MVCKGSEEARLEDTEGDRAGEPGRDADDEGTAGNPKVASRPAAPIKSMVMAHEVHHADYREWCARCIASRGVSHKHRTSAR